MSGRDDVISGLDRRRFLATVTAVTATGLAGCSDQTGGGNGSTDPGGDGDVDGGGGGTSDGAGSVGGGDSTDAGGDEGTDAGGSGDGEDGTPADLACSSVTDGYERQDVGERPLIFDFEYPSVVGDPEYVKAPQSATYTGEREVAGGALHVDVVQLTIPGMDQGESQGQTGAATTEFDGETVQFVGGSTGSELAWTGNLPYDIDGQRMLFNVTVSLSYTGEASNECGDALRAAAEHIVTSMAVNPETTIANELGSA